MDSRIPNQLGYLLLTEDGAVLSSSGALENDERSADIIMTILQLTGNLQQLDQRNQNILSHTQQQGAADAENPIRKVSLVYDDHCYVICLSNRRIHVVKKTFSPPVNVQQAEQQQQREAHTVQV